MDYTNSKSVKEALATPKDYFYTVDLNERGSFLAHVENEAGDTVFSIRAGDELGPDESSIFEDGYMSHSDDLCGLSDYLQDLGIMTTHDTLWAGR